ncbi:uncharacterized protein LOC136029714 [Artemia franciscana]|uniref:uncharacterized protein LOC136029714 n=1 Tax=Artemia franciscana TaxID=6661 RepID=UPI0032DB52BF
MVLMDKGIPFDVTLFDLAKSIDRVYHRRLIVKLHSAEINNQVVGWIQAFLTEMIQQIRIFTSHGMLIYSNSLLVKSGVVQVSFLGPTLFNTFINDACSMVHNYLTLYADDSKPIGGIRNQLDADVFQHDINELNNWSNAWLLSFDTFKSHVLHFGENNLDFGYTLNDLLLQAVHKDRDLGILVDEKLKFDSHAATAASSVNHTIGKMMRTISSCSPGVMTTLYKALV